MNYYPADAGWEKMWRTADSRQLDRDFGAISKLGANAVRVVVQPAAVGYPKVTDGGAAKFRVVLALARKHGLAVQVSLFDHWKSYSEIDQSKRWAKDLLGAYSSDHSIALVELQNEIDPHNRQAIAWAKVLLPYLHRIAAKVPRTIDVRGIGDTTLFESLMGQLDKGSVDVLDIHLYGSKAASESLLRAARRIAGDRPVIVGEAGASTFGPDARQGDARQLAFYKDTLSVCRAQGIGWFSPWILSDFTAHGNESGSSDNAEALYGIRRVDGTWKPAADVVAEMFGGAKP